MLDGVTLDQLRTFLATVDEGSFSGAGRKLRRGQSVVSQRLANLESVSAGLVAVAGLPETPWEAVLAGRLGFEPR